jgi:hypothetical protein
MAEATVRDYRGRLVTGRIVGFHPGGIVEIEADEDDARRVYGRDLTRASAQPQRELERRLPA